MKNQSAKSKGRRLQQWVCAKLLEYLDLGERDVKSTSMGASGADVILSEKAFKLFPYDVECKNVEKVNVWAAYEQASVRASGEPLVIIKRNRQKPLALVDAEYFVKLHGGGNG